MCHFFFFFGTFATWLPFVNRRRCCVVDCVRIFDPCINRGSVYVLDPRWEAFTTGERRERGQWPTWFGGHIAWDHMYEGMQEHDPGRTDAVCYLWIANCSVTGLHVTPPDQRFIKVRHETLMSERTHKRLNVLLVVCCAPSARDKKPLSEISVLFIHSLRWRERKKKKNLSCASSCVHFRHGVQLQQHPLIASFFSFFFCWATFLPVRVQGKQDCYCTQSFLSLGQCLPRDPQLSCSVEAV